ncbi:ankyrin repeat domain-containing protein [bacterium]|nr:ankyrin repeat domain-containing protein [bacterium]
MQLNYKKIFILLVPVLFLKLPVQAFDVTQLGDYESRSIYYSMQKNPTSQEHRDLLKSKKLSENIRCLIKQIEQNKIENVRLLLNSNVNVNSGYIGETPLYVAVKKNNYEITKLLLENKAKPDQGFYSELQLSINNKNQDIAHLLIKYNANVNYTTLVTEDTLLYLSLKNNMFETSERLIQKGAKIDSKSEALIKKKKLDYLLEK